MVWGLCSHPGGPIPEHPVPASQVAQDSYVSKSSPFGGLGGLKDCKPLMDQILGARSYIPSVISATRTASTLKSHGIPTLPRWTFEGDRESCALKSHVRRFRED